MALDCLGFFLALLVLFKYGGIILHCTSLFEPCGTYLHRLDLGSRGVASGVPYSESSVTSITFILFILNAVYCMLQLNVPAGSAHFDVVVIISKLPTRLFRGMSEDYHCFPRSSQLLSSDQAVQSTRVSHSHATACRIGTASRIQPPRALVAEGSVSLNGSPTSTMADASHLHGGRLGTVEPFSNTPGSFSI